MKLTTGWRRALRGCAALLLLLAVLVQPPPPGAAQTDFRYFSETGHWLHGAFRQFWERNGGVRTFGFPVSEEFVQNSNCRVAQYFERARFELGPNGVELAWLGAELTGGRLFPEVPPFAAPAGTTYFADVQHTLKGAFRDTWNRGGGAPIFGLPISEEMYDRVEDGSFHLVQWYQKSRFELWPEGVRISRLGAFQVPWELRLPWPPNVRPPGPLTNDGFPRPPAWSGVASLGYAALGTEPASGAPGTKFTILGAGFQPGEQVIFWRQSPDQQIFPLTDVAVADGNGAISGARIQFATGKKDQQGIWFIVGVGTASGRRGVAAFQLGSPPQPGPCGNVGPAPQPPPPAESTLTVAPASGPVGQTFTANGRGYQSGESVSVWLTAPDQSVRAVTNDARADRNGNLSVAITTDQGFASGRWAVTARGNSSGLTGIAYFTLGGGGGGGGGGTGETVQQVAFRMGISLQNVFGLNGVSNIVPLAAPPGVAFTLNLGGFAAGERVSVWLTSPAGEVEGVDPGAVRATGPGAVTAVFTPRAATLGDWKLTAQGQSSGRQVILPFKVTRDYVAPLGTPRPPSRNGSVAPVEGGQSTRFVLSGFGLNAGEPADHWITSPDGIYVLVGRVNADRNGRIGYSQRLVVQFGAQNPSGIYGYHWRGVRSGKQIDLYLTYTGAP
jgi:hypothetical protein